jgi:protein-disulfide isomerase
VTPGAADLAGNPCPGLDNFGWELFAADELARHVTGPISEASRRLIMRWSKTVGALGVAALLALLPSAAPSACAQADDALKTLKEDVQQLKEGQTRMQRQLDEIHNLLRARAGAPPTGPGAHVTVDGAPTKGDKDARVTLVEFSDYQCPFCGRFYRETWPEIDRDYVKTGKVKYVFRDFPLEGLHPQALKAAEAAHCAGEQGKYWAMHDRLFDGQAALEDKDLAQHAGAVGADVTRFEQCLQSGRYTAQVRQSLQDGVQLGVSGTPTFIVGLSEPGSSTIKAAAILRGAQPYSSFKQALDSVVGPGK